MSHTRSEQLGNFVHYWIKNVLPQKKDMTNGLNTQKKINGLRNEHI